MVDYFKTDLGIVVKNEKGYKLKSTYEHNAFLSENDFSNSNPIKIKKQIYLESLNKWFKESKHKWKHNGTNFRRLDNFEMKGYYSNITNYDIQKIPKHNIGDISFKTSCIIVLYQNTIYYTFFCSNYYPQMQLIDFKTKQLVGKWTHIKNLCPIFNVDKKEII